MNNPIWSVGLMTGTVLDGNIDVALLKTDGERIETFGAYALVPYPTSIRTMLEKALSAARIWNFEGPDPAIFAEAEEALTRAQAAAVKQVVDEAGLTMADIGVVGFHGQSVLHRGPQNGRRGDTRQLGDGELMHAILGTKVVYDFRTADIRAGGHGAPLAAAYHAALLGTAGASGDSAILNLGILARQRVQVLPFLLALIVALAWDESDTGRDMMESRRKRRAPGLNAGRAGTGSVPSVEPPAETPSGPTSRAVRSRPQPAPEGPTQGPGNGRHSRR